MKPPLWFRVRPFLIRARNANAAAFQKSTFAGNRFLYVSETHPRVNVSEIFVSDHRDSWNNWWNNGYRFTFADGLKRQFLKRWFFNFHQIKNYIWSKIYYYVFWNNIWIYNTNFYYKNITKRRRKLIISKLVTKEHMTSRVPQPVNSEFEWVKSKLEKSLSFKLISSLFLLKSSFWI